MSSTVLNSTMYDPDETYYVADGSTTYYEYSYREYVKNYKGYIYYYSNVDVPTYKKATKTKNLGNFINSKIHHSTLTSTDFIIDSGEAIVENLAKTYQINFNVTPVTATASGILHI